jgi:hypothetical protein
MASAVDVSSLVGAVRDVSEDEVAHYVEHGWVKLEGFVPPELAAELLQVGERIMAEAEQLIASAPGLGEGREVSEPSGAWQAHSIPAWFKARSITLEPFASVKSSPQLGRVAQRCMNFRRLTDEPVGVRLLGDHLICKRPQGTAGSAPTPIHQDSEVLRAHGQLAYWIALDDVTPEMGSMRFLDGSHREGLLGVDDWSQDHRRRYPRLVELYEVTPPLHYGPGDATIHNEFLLHWAPENTTTRPRWALNIDYIPSGAVVAQDDSPIDHPGVRPAAELEHRYPLVYV